MPVIAIFSGIHTSGKEVAAQIASRLECDLVEEDLLDAVSKKYKANRGDLVRTLRGETSFFNNLTHKWENHLVFLKAEVADRLIAIDAVLSSRAALMIPKEITHVLRICIVADHSFRVDRAMKKENLSKNAAEKIIDEDDICWERWTRALFNRSPWDRSLYDLVIPSHSLSIEEASSLVLENAAKTAINPTSESVQAVQDFMLASKINAQLALAGHSFCDVTARRGLVKIIINKNVLRLEHLEKELKKLVQPMNGVKEVSTQVGPRYNQPDIAVKFDFEVPESSKANILLVDDEQEYITTLSERLQMRDFKSDVVLNGEKAISYIEASQTDVMVLDLRMPGIDGIEVLRRVRQSHPDIQVIVLTGHGTDKDKKIVLDLGAFAYLEKPVSIDLLAQTIQEAKNASKLRTDKESM